MKSEQIMNKEQSISSLLVAENGIWFLFTRTKQKGLGHIQDIEIQKNERKILSNRSIYKSSASRIGGKTASNLLQNLWTNVIFLVVLFFSSRFQQQILQLSFLHRIYTIKHFPRSSWIWWCILMLHSPETDDSARGPGSQSGWQPGRPTGRGSDPVAAHHRFLIAQNRIECSRARARRLDTEAGGPAESSFQLLSRRRSEPASAPLTPRSPSWRPAALGSGLHGRDAPVLLRPPAPWSRAGSEADRRR